MVVGVSMIWASITSCLVTPTVRLQDQLLRMSLALAFVDQLVERFLVDVDTDCHKLLWEMFFSVLFLWYIDSV